MAEQEDLGKMAERYWNASPDSHQQLDAASVIVSVVFSLIFLLGTVGNSLVLAVLLHSGQIGYNTTNLFILNLAVADFFFIIFCVPFQATIYALEGWVFGTFMCKVVHFFINLTMYASSFTLAAVSVDRYLAIRYPLRSRELRTPCNACLAMVVIWGLSLVFAGPYLSYYDLVTVDNRSMCVPALKVYSRKVLDTCTFAFGYVIPVLIVSLSYTRTIKYLWTAVDPLDGMSESKRAKRKVTKMIIIVTVLFCICWLPYHVVLLCYLYGDFPFNDTTYALRLLSHCMAYANSCLNPIVYALVSKHFRKGFRKVFSSCVLVAGGKGGRNKVHVVHVANTVPGFEAASTEVSQMMQEENGGGRGGGGRGGRGGGGGGGGGGRSIEHEMESRPAAPGMEVVSPPAPAAAPSAPPAAPPAAPPPPPVPTATVPMAVTVKATAAPSTEAAMAISLPFQSQP